MVFKKTSDFLKKPKGGEKRIASPPQGNKPSPIRAKSPPEYKFPEIPKRPKYWGTQIHIDAGHENIDVKTLSQKYSPKELYQLMFDTDKNTQEEVNVRAKCFSALKEHYKTDFYGDQDLYNQVFKKFRNNDLKAALNKSRMEISTGTHPPIEKKALHKKYLETLILISFCESELKKIKG